MCINESDYPHPPTTKRRDGASVNEETFEEKEKEEQEGTRDWGEYNPVNRNSFLGYVLHNIQSTGIQFTIYVPIFPLSPSTPDWVRHCKLAKKLNCSFWRDEKEEEVEYDVDKDKRE